MPVYARRRVVTMGVGATVGWWAWLQGSGSAISLGQPMPEFQGIQAWLNSPPLRVKDLRGHVVAVQFWTLGCINCQRTFPHVTQLDRDYREQGLVVVGVHTPEFPYERDLGNIRAAIDRYGIEYAVAVDNQFKTWQAYQNRYWPHLFIADQKGQIAFHHIGEGAYDEMEQTVQALLKG